MSDKLLTAKEVQKMLNISHVTLWRYRSEGKITTLTFPHHKLRFKKEEIEKILKEGLNA